MRREEISRIMRSLGRSRFRSRFVFNARDMAYARRHGLETLRRHTVELVGTRIAPCSPRNDGRQTPMRGHPVFVAQHATATCCRKCLARWHGLKEGVDLGEEEVEYVVEVIMRWIAAMMGEKASSGREEVKTEEGRP